MQRILAALAIGGAVLLTGERAEAITGATAMPIPVTIIAVPSVHAVQYRPYRRPHRRYYRRHHRRYYYR